MTELPIALGEEVRTAMKKQYARPELIEYGSLGSLTLGIGAQFPDFDQQFNNVGNCNTTDPTVTACLVTSST